MLTLKNYCFGLILGVMVVWAQGAASVAPVPVEKEPLHHVVLKNESIMVMHLVLPAGERTLYHTHSHDRIAVNLSSASITQQKLGDAEGEPTSVAPGNFSALTLEGSSYTHRVHNVGAAQYDVIDVEILDQPATPSAATATVVAAENPSARVYNWPLAAGTASAMHAHVRPYLILATTDLTLKMTAPDGQTSTHEVKRGEFHWVDAKVTHSLANTGNKDGQIVEIELK
jgi:quercetin dioxygenase-like cupin family protein